MAPSASRASGTRGERSGSSGGPGTHSPSTRKKAGSPPPPPSGRPSSTRSELKADSVPPEVVEAPPVARRSLQDPALLEYLRRMIQSDGVKILNALAEAGEGTDEKIAEASAVNLYLVRKILYTLYEMRLTEYRRKRNEENGWLTYHWSINWRELEVHLAREVQKLTGSLSTRIQHERDNLFYACPREGLRLLFEAASEAQFRCPNCGAALEAVDNQGLVSAMETRQEALSRAWPGP